MALRSLNASFPSWSFIHFSKSNLLIKRTEKRPSEIDRKHIVPRIVWMIELSWILIYVYRISFFVKIDSLKPKQWPIKSNKIEWNIDTVRLIKNTCKHLKSFSFNFQTKLNIKCFISGPMRKMRIASILKRL
jgi:hypothetical protein